MTAAAAAAAAENNPDPSLQSPPSKVTTSQSQTKSKPVAPTVSKITTNTPRSTEPHNDLNISLDSVTSSVSSAKKSSRKRKKRSDPTQCLEIISLMYDRYYQQEVGYYHIVVHSNLGKISRPTLHS